MLCDPGQVPTLSELQFPHLWNLDFKGSSAWLDYRELLLKDVCPLPQGLTLGTDACQSRARVVLSPQENKPQSTDSLSKIIQPGLPVKSPGQLFGCKKPNQIRGNNMCTFIVICMVSLLTTHTLDRWGLLSALYKKWNQKSEKGLHQLVWHGSWEVVELNILWSHKSVYYKPNHMSMIPTSSDSVTVSVPNVGYCP